MQRRSTFVSRLRYYLTSIPTLLTGFRNPWTLLTFILQLRGDRLLYLRNGLVFRVRSAMDAWVVKETCLDRDYEPPGLSIQPDWVMVDLGAGIGEFAVAAARKAYLGRVYAYEPFPDSFRLLVENARLNGVNNITAEPYAIGAENGPMHLSLATGVPVLYSTVAGEGIKDGRAIRVEGKTLEDVLNTHRIRRCDLLKVDCEGAEFEILFQTCPDTLGRVMRIALEYHDSETGNRHDQLAEYLESAGFSVTLKPNPVHAHTGLLYAQRYP